jgi:acetyl esterase/lipase
MKTNRRSTAAFWLRGAKAPAAALRIGAAVALVTAMPVEAQDIGRKLADRALIGEGVTAVGADSFAVTRVDFPDGVIGMPDVTYATLPGYRPMKLDLFLPPDSFSSKGPRPVVVYIHGGGWVAGGPRRSAAYKDWPRVLASLAGQGYVVASVAYRFAKEAPFPAAIQDVKTAIRWLRANAEDYDIDKNRFVTWGQSAGGQLASLAAVSCGVAALAPEARVVPNNRTVEIAPSTAEGADQESDCVQGAVSWFGIYDFATMPPLGPAATYLGCGEVACTRAKQDAASPLFYVDRSDPPTLLMHGTEDKTVPVAQSRQFQSALAAAGVKSELIVIPGAEHSWLGATPEATRDVSRMALARSIDFIEAVIGDGRVRR